MINQTNVFDIYDVFVNELIGDLWLTILLGLILVLFISIKAKMPIQATILLSILWLVIMVAGVSVNLEVIWVFILYFAATFFYYTISKAFKRG